MADEASATFATNAWGNFVALSGASGSLEPNAMDPSATKLGATIPDAENPSAENPGVMNPNATSPAAMDPIANARDIGVGGIDSGGDDGGGGRVSIKAFLGKRPGASRGRRGRLADFLPPAANTPDLATSTTTSPRAARDESGRQQVVVFGNARILPATARRHEWH